MPHQETRRRTQERRLRQLTAAALTLFLACGTDSARAPNELFDGHELCNAGDEGCCAGVYCEEPDICVEDACFTIPCSTNEDCPEGALCSETTEFCVPDLDAGHIDAGRRDGGKADAGRADAGRADAGRPDAGRPDAGRPDAGRPDAGRPDAGRPDAGTVDAGRPDAGRPDAGPPDAGRPDAGPPDAGRPDAGPPDAGRPDGGRPDAGSVDAGRPDAGAPDAGRPDAGVRDGGTVCCGSCGSGTVCNTATCQCVNPNTQCSSNANCLSGYVCVPISQIGMSYCLQVCSSASSCSGNQPCCSIPGQTVGVCSPIGVCQ